MLEHDETSEGAGLSPAAPPEALWFPLRRGRGGVRLNDDGLTETARGYTRFAAWSNVLAMYWSPDYATLVTRDYDFRLDRRYADWPALARAVDARAGLGSVEVGVGAVTPEMICGWLGIPVDGRLALCLPVQGPHSCWNVFSRRWWAYLVVQSLLIEVIVLTCSPAFSVALGLAVLAIGLAAQVLGRRPDTVRASATGLSLRVGAGWHHFAWSDLQGVRRLGVNWGLETPRGTYTVSCGARGEHGRLAQALQNLCAARNQGLTLPSDTPTPDTALSRPTPDPTSPRALSRADEGPGEPADEEPPVRGG